MRLPDCELPGYRVASLSQTITPDGNVYAVLFDGFGCRWSVSALPGSPLEPHAFRHDPTLDRAVEVEHPALIAEALRIIHSYWMPVTVPA